ncbi:DHH family phosphoesterase [Oscillibacter valericigenes]|uniref:DHH family phosphoesterase n=1 Tax=Oscillibacter valericigenes TaxID=351091 RepID=UPI001F1DD1A3|nr:DHH family phosphoesterase [Oscillibacter valericigenes]MCF2665242.1 DHH family phosphoesterase [Oscillibacter valericigenes]
MNNNKLSRLLEPNLKFYFLCLALFALAAVAVSIPLAVIEGVATVALYLYFTQSNKKRRQSVLQYIDSVTGSVDTASKSTLINSPLPIMVFRPDTGEVIWSNENFLQLAGVREHLFEMRVEDAVPEFPVQWLLEGKQECPNRVFMNNRRFRVYGSLVRAKGRGGEQNLVATTYWVDTTDADQLLETYTATRPVLSILMLDNYEDLMKSCADTQRSAVLAQIDEKLSAWAAAGEGLLLKTERDRYLFIFEEQHYEHFVEEKFSVLDAIRGIKVGEGVHPTLSIGMGKDVDSFPELYKNASLSLEMALSRGGDQAVVRNKVDFEFYGGRAKATEKRTKVKSRVMANALSELMADASEIYVMGHSFADMDAVGAAAGICCAARKRGKRAQIVIDLEHNAALPVLKKLGTLPEYSGVFISGNDAFVKMRPGALLVVVDTNRPDLVESHQVLEACNRVAVIDHHRRAASYIENAAFSFHEPYASSAAELVTELLQYLVEPADLLREEAEALLAGIVLDTKRFTLRTGGRTFEAAAFLRRAGADTAEVQRLFQNDLSDMVSRYDIIRRAEMYREDIALAVIPQDGVDRVAAAQAADELLTLKGVRASFVLYRNGDDVLMSARSMGEVNVQVILEALGGGGNSSQAGGRVENGDILAVRAQLTDAIDAYFEK